MNPSKYIEEMRDGIELKGILTPKQIMDAQEVLDVGMDYIGRTMSKHYDDMTPEAVDAAQKLQAFLIVFVEHCNNISLLRKLDL